MSQHRRAMRVNLHRVELLLLAFVMIPSACARKTTQKETSDSSSGVSQKATKGVASKVPGPRRRTPQRLVIKPTAVAPAPMDLIALFSSKVTPSKAGKKAKASPESAISLLRRPTAIGGARYVVVIGQPGATAKDGSRGLTIRVAVVEKVGPRWQLRGILGLPTEGAHISAATRRSVKAGRLDPKEVRAGLRLRDIDKDGRPEAIVRYRYPMANAVRENYAILNLDVAPTRGFFTILALIDPATGKPKQLSRIYFSDADGDGKPELRRVTRSGGKTMTTLYTYDSKADRFVAGDRVRKRAVKRALKGAVKHAVSPMTTQGSH
ncbi:MAG: hypothetical protein KAI47_07315 [Deltaproteobacteria bacterium]|nr:hypothetical protein [Deltaproteobacteria bacterium]